MLTSFLFNRVLRLCDQRAEIDCYARVQYADVQEVFCRGSSGTLPFTPEKKKVNAHEPVFPYTSVHLRNKDFQGYTVTFSTAESLQSSIPKLEQVNFVPEHSISVPSSNIQQLSYPKQIDILVSQDVEVVYVDNPSHFYLLTVDRKADSTRIKTRHSILK
jgi:hypothetical protein